MLNAARGEKQTPEKQKACSRYIPRMLSMCVLQTFTVFVLILCLLFGQMLVENRAEAGVSYWECVCVFVFCMCVWEANVLPPNENRTQSHEGPSCPLFGAHMQSKTQAHTRPPLPFLLALMLFLAVE